MTEQQHAVKAGKGRKRCSLRLASSASQGAGQTARISTTEDGSTHPLAERLKPEPFRTQNKVAVLGTLAGRMGTSEVSSRWWMRHLQDALSSHRDGTRDFLQRATTRRIGLVGKLGSAKLVHEHRLR